MHLHSSNDHQSLNFAHSITKNDFLTNFFHNFISNDCHHICREYQHTRLALKCSVNTKKVADEESVEFNVNRLCLCVFVSLCVCVFVSLCLCVFVSLCLCVYVFGQHKKQPMKSRWSSM